MGPGASVRLTGTERDPMVPADVRRRIRAIFARSFFPGSDPVVQQLSAAILFAFGFIVCPVGGWLFGHLADSYGRRRAGHAWTRAHDSGTEPWRRIRHERDVPERSGRQAEPPLLLELPVRDAHRRTALRRHRPSPPAAGVPDTGGTESVGLALVALAMRRNLHETDEFVAAKAAVTG